MKNKITFIKIGSFSGKNNFVLKMLQDRFPDHLLEVIDVWKDLVPYRSAAGFLAAVREFGLRVLWGNYAMAVLRARRSFEHARYAVRRRLAPGGTTFTFQTGSSFDLSVPGVPHFVYTDGTNSSMARQFPRGRRPWPALAVAGLRDGLIRRRDQRWFYTVRSAVAMSIVESCVDDPVKRAREAEVFRNAAVVFTMSTDVRRDVVERYGCPGEKVVCVYSGGHRDPDPGTAGAPQRYHRKNVLFIGSEWERKGGPELVAAFRKVRSVHPEATLTVVGCSPKVEAEGCLVVGPVPAETVGGYYERASVFCVPSRAEAFGNVFVEAMHFKLPVVAVRTGALPDMVTDGQNGYLVEPGDVGRLAVVLTDLLAHPEKCRALGERGHAVAREKYTWEKTGALIRERVAECLGRGPDRDGNRVVSSGEKGRA